MTKVNEKIKEESELVRWVEYRELVFVVREDLLDG